MDLVTPPPPFLPPPPGRYARYLISQEAHVILQDLKSSFKSLCTKGGAINLRAYE